MRILLLLLVVTISILHPKVLIITHAFNRPDFIEIQDKTFKKFLKDDYEFVVFSDANESQMQQRIHKICSRLHIQCVDIPQEIHDRPYLQRWPGEGYHSPSVRTSNAIQYSLNEFGFKHDDIVVVIDSDMFLVKDFSIREYLGEAVLAGLPQDRDSKGYLWNGLVFMNMPLLPDRCTLDFNCGKLDNTPVDSGGQIYHYLQKHPALAIKYMDSLHFNSDKPKQYKQKFLDKRPFLDILARNFLLKKPDNIEFLLYGTFLHYRGGANWNQKSPEYHAQKTKLLNEYLKALLQ